MALSIQDQQLATHLNDIAVQVRNTWLADPVLGPILRREVQHKQLQLLSDDWPATA